MTQFIAFFMSQNDLIYELSDQLQEMPTFGWTKHHLRCLGSLNLKLPYLSLKMFRTTQKGLHLEDFVVLPRTSFLQDAGHASICWRKLHGGNVPKRTWYKFNVLYLHSGIVKLTLCTSEERCSLQKLYTLLYRGNPRAFLMLACAIP